MYTRIHVLTIPLTLDVPTAHRTILQVLLRRRADGPLVVREENDRERSTGSGLVQACFSERATLDLSQQELRRHIPYLQMQVREERRRSAFQADLPCSCVLQAVRGTRPNYLQEDCPRHS